MGGGFSVGFGKKGGSLAARYLDLKVWWRVVSVYGGWGYFAPVYMLSSFFFWGGEGL